MENTLPNKAAFFMHYPNIDYHCSTPLGTSSGSLLDACDIINFYDFLDQNSYIELSELSQITDDDAIEISKMHYRIDTSTAESGRELLNMFKRVSGSLPSNVVDYLRSKGYAYMFGDLSIEEQIEYGWMVLIQ